ncbi:hypothetical protein [Streptomyces sp. NPDC087300]|uniref:hypothetical protein n=1 Tax=Streptomyces sp. NPDC087300 TaxID=3365780 RepID=UPI00381274FF
MRDQLRAERASQTEPVAYEDFETEPLAGLEEAASPHQGELSTAPVEAARPQQQH